MSKKLVSVKYGEEFENMILSKVIELEEKDLQKALCMMASLKILSCTLTKSLLFVYTNAQSAMNLPFFREKQSMLEQIILLEKSQPEQRVCYHFFPVLFDAPLFFNFFTSLSKSLSKF